MPRMFSHDDILHYVPLEGTERALLHGSRPAGPADPNEPMTVTVQVRSRASDEDLDEAFEELSRTPLDQQTHLSHADLEQKFGASPDDLDAVEEFAQHFNLAVLERDPNKQTVVLGGRTGDFARAFRIQLNRYHLETGTYRGRTGPVNVPR